MTFKGKWRNMKSLERTSSNGKANGKEKRVQRDLSDGLPDPGYPRECEYCHPRIGFATTGDFAKHLRAKHAAKEGGSYLCRYGENGVCQRLPIEGVSDVDFEAHIRRCHASSLKITIDDVPSLRSSRANTMDSDVTSSKFSLSSFTQNLSAVLADPNRSRNEVNNLFTKHWGDAFVPTAPVQPSKKLPIVAPKAFDVYKNTTGEAYRKYRAVRRALRVSQEGASEEKYDADDLPTVFIDPRFALSDADTFSAIFTVPADESIDALRQTLSGRVVVPATPTDLSSTKKPGAFRDYDSLQSRLELMHDVVDGRLASKLVSKTDAFWQVVRSYSGLQEQLARAMKSVTSVRKHLKAVDELVCERSNRIVEMHAAGERKRKLLAKLHDIACLREAQSTVQMMLSQGDYPKAIDCIETSLEVLSGELNGVVCFRHLGSQLRELYDMIGRMMHEDFASSIQKELGVKPDSGTMIQSEVEDVVAQGELSAVLLGLMRMRKYGFMGVLREEIQEGIKNIMRQVVKTQIIDSGLDLTEFDPSLMQLGDPVRRLKHSQFVATVAAVMNELFDFCKRLSVALQLLMLEMCERAEAARGVSTKEEPNSFDTLSIPVAQRRRRQSPGGETISDDEEEEDATMGGSTKMFTIGGTIPVSSASATVLMSIDVSSDSFLKLILPLIAEYGHQCAQQRISRLLIARAKNVTVTEKTTPTELAEVLTLVVEYQKRCEEQGWYSTQATKAGPLARAVSKLSVDYIERFHAFRKLIIGKALDSEMWKAADVPAGLQTNLSESLASGRLRNATRTSLSPTPSRASSTTTLDSLANATLGQPILLDQESFVVVGSCATMLRLLGDYCEAIATMPSFAQDWLSRVVELLKIFNSRSCQLILGAGALQLVGLRTISVRNLALAARSLQLIIRFVPLVADEMDRVLGDDRKHLLRHFKQVQSDYSDHIGEIIAKLVSVIDHYTTNCLGMWEVKGVIPSPEFQQICRHMSKFHNGLAGIMPPKEIQGLFQRVHKNFKANLKEQLRGMGITPHDSLKFGYVTQDYMFYQQSVNLMESCRDMELESLNDILFND